MTKTLEAVNGVVWGIPALVLILGVGIYLSLRTGFIQLIFFPKALKAFCARFRKKDEEDGVSPFRALCTALAATVGTGNIAGVAGAIALGGPGAVFWMWLSAAVGMVTKFAEATLAVRYRSRTRQGEFVGGPMHMIRKGLPKKFWWLAYVYSFFGVVAAFGVGNATQVNAMITGLNEALPLFGIEATQTGNLVMGILLAVIIGAMLLGGAKRIGAVAEGLVPAASLLYTLLCMGVLIRNTDQIPSAFQAILKSALCPEAFTGGLLGSWIRSMRVGVSRGVFTNEAGMGTASIAHAGAEVEHPVEQGLMGIMEVFLDTIVICTMTALAILCSGVSVPYGTDPGAELTVSAFASVYGPWVKAVIALFLGCFAFATVLGWGLYGIRCAQFLFGNGVWRKFVILQAGAVVLGAVLNTRIVWLLSETVNGLMAIPNLIALAALSPELFRLIREYRNQPGRRSANGGTYEYFHQRKPLRTLSYAEIPSPGGGREAEGKEDLSSEHRSA